MVRCQIREQIFQYCCSSHFPNTTKQNRTQSTLLHVYREAPCFADEVLVSRTIALVSKWGDNIGFLIAGLLISHLQGKVGLLRNNYRLKGFSSVIMQSSNSSCQNSSLVANYDASLYNQANNVTTETTVAAADDGRRGNQSGNKFQIKHLERQLHLEVLNRGAKRPSLLELLTLRWLVSTHASTH